MRILGIDPGYAIVGYGIIDYHCGHFSVVGYGAVTTSAGIPFPERLNSIYKDIQFDNAKTAIHVGQARGVIVLAAEAWGLSVNEYTPLQVKQSVTGYGRAEKHQVMEMVKSLLCLKAVPKPDDTADALAIAVCHAHYSGSACSKICMEVKKR